MADERQPTVRQSRHQVIECGAGAKNLRRALAEIDAAGLTVVSVVEDRGGGFMSAVGSGASFGFLIVVRSR